MSHLKRTRYTAKMFIMVTRRARKWADKQIQVGRYPSMAALVTQLLINDEKTCYSVYQEFQEKACQETLEAREEKADPSTIVENQESIEDVGAV